MARTERDKMLAGELYDASAPEIQAELAATHRWLARYNAALDTAQDEISSQLAEVESRELRHVEQALERMRDGGYGLCERCSLKIPVARLNALPYATSCIDCQREMEREGADGGYSADWSRLLDHSDGDADLTINDIEIDVP